jgi:hypothetical protein
MSSDMNHDIDRKVKTFTSVYLKDEAGYIYEFAGLKSKSWSDTSLPAKMRLLGMYIKLDIQYHWDDDVKNISSSIDLSNLYRTPWNHSFPQEESKI